MARENSISLNNEQIKKFYNNIRINKITDCHIFMGHIFKQFIKERKELIYDNTN